MDELLELIEEAKKSSGVEWKRKGNYIVYLLKN